MQQLKEEEANQKVSREEESGKREEGKLIKVVTCVAPHQEELLTVSLNRIAIFLFVVWCWSVSLRYLQLIGVQSLEKCGQHAYYTFNIGFGLIKYFNIGFGLQIFQM